LDCRILSSWTRRKKKKKRNIPPPPRKKRKSRHPGEEPIFRQKKPQRGVRKGGLLLPDLLSTWALNIIPIFKNCAEKKRKKETNRHCRGGRKKPPLKKGNWLPSGDGKGERGSAVLHVRGGGGCRIPCRRETNPRCLVKEGKKKEGGGAFFFEESRENLAGRAKKRGKDIVALCAAIERGGRYRRKEARTLFLLQRSRKKKEKGGVRAAFPLRPRKREKKVSSVIGRCSRGKKGARGLGGQEGEKKTKKASGKKKRGAR